MNKDTKNVLIQMSEIITEQNGELNMMRKRIAGIEARPNVSIEEFEALANECNALRENLAFVKEKLLVTKDAMPKMKTKEDCNVLFNALFETLNDIYEQQSTTEG